MSSVGSALSDERSETPEVEEKPEVMFNNLLELKGKPYSSFDKAASRYHIFAMIVPKEEFQNTILSVYDIYNLPYVNYMHYSVKDGIIYGAFECKTSKKFMTVHSPGMVTHYGGYKSVDYIDFHKCVNYLRFARFNYGCSHNT